MKQWRRLLGYLRPYLWWRVVAAIVSMTLFSAVESSVPFVMRFVFDEVFVKENWERLNQAAFYVLAAGLARGWLDFSAGYLNDWIGMRIVTDLRTQLVGKLQRLDLAFFNRERAGGIVSRITSDVGLVRESVTSAITSIFQDITRLIGLLATAVYMIPLLAVAAASLFPIAGVPVALIGRRIRTTVRKRQEVMGRLTAALHENIQGNRVVKAFGQEALEHERFGALNERLFKQTLRVSRLTNLPITEMLAGFFVAGIVYYGGQLVIRHEITAGQFVGFVMAIMLLYEPFKRLVRTYNNLQQGLAGADRVFALLDTEAHVTDRPGARPLPPMQAGIEFRNVGFEYLRGEPVLRHINLHIPFGQMVALVGTSGGGKSTLADLIPRFYDVTAGQITIDGADLRDVTLASLREQIAIVTQFTFLFNDSVRNNISYGDPRRTMAEIVRAAQAANADEFVRAMPEGYETHIGDLGVRLSGGQRQRLAIARAILKNAPILILDEATSALDTASEGVVQEALERLMANRTTLVVAHRLSTVRRADQIVVVAHGEIVESGTHDELMARGTEYRKLYDLQFRDQPADDAREPPQQLAP